MAAPLVTLDEEWQDFYEVKEWSPGLGQGEGQGQGYGRRRHERLESSENLNELNLLGEVVGRVGCGEELPEMDNFTSEMMSFKSMEDLVNDFDEKLNVCFHNYNQKTEVLAPVKQPGSTHSQHQGDRDRDTDTEEEELIRDDEIWDALTDNYVTSDHEDWRVARLQELNMNMTNMESIDKETITEEGELIEKVDFIVSSTSEEPLFTADQVIEEIEEMMQNSPDPDEEEEEEEEEEEDEVTSQSDKLSVCSKEEIEVKMARSSSPEDDVRQMPETGLRGLLEEIEGETRGYSEELIQQLALRDELEFEKEVKNSFISILIEVQNKQKEQRESMKRKKKEKGGSPQSSRPERGNHMPIKRFSMEGISSVIQSGIRQTFGNSGNERQYLTTVIPYEKKAVPPNVEDLQILTTILLAMKEESEKVPVLLTDYILKVLCPT